MATTLFEWISDTDGDGVLSDELARYSTAIWLPNQEQPDGGRQVAGGTVSTLDGGVLVLVQTRAGYADRRLPGSFTLRWDIADPEFIRLAREDYAKGRLVQVRLDWRWRQCEVTSSGAADRKVTVAAGEIDADGDSYWLASDTVVTCGASDTKVYAALADGVATPGSGTSVPAGAVLLANISIAGSVVTVTSSPSGVANARQGYIVPGSWRTRQNGPHTGLEFTVQEVR